MGAGRLGVGRADRGEVSEGQERLLFWKSLLFSKRDLSCDVEK